MKSSYRVEAQTSSEREPFIVLLCVADSGEHAITKAIDALQLRGLLVSEKILTSHRIPL